MSTHVHSTRKQVATFLAAGFAICVLVLISTAPRANAAWEFQQLGASTSIGGKFTRQAAAHPDLTVKLRWTPNEAIRNVDVDIPPGMAGNPTVLDECTLEQLTTIPAPVCPPTTQVGTADIVTPGEGISTVKLYNMVSPTNLPALFAFNYQQVVVLIEPNIDPVDYSIKTTVRDVSLAEPFTGSTVVLWGVPSDSSHKRMGEEFNLEKGDFRPIPDPAPKTPFIRTPTSCPDTPTPFTAKIESWQGSALGAEAFGDPEGTQFLWDGCFRVPFEPTMEVIPGAHATAQPTGLDVTVNVPQNQDPKGLGSADVRKTVVTLPKGFSISPAAASGIGGCSEAQMALGTHKAPTCPGSSSLGEVKLRTPLLDEELDGEIFLAKQNENPFHNLLTVYLAIKGPGFWIKLPGETSMDSQNGQVTSTFDNTPQLPFERLKIAFRGGAKAPLVSPDKCGTYVTKIDMYSWASPVPRHLESPLTIDERCDTGGFDPRLNAGSTNPVAGANTPFNVRFTRNDGEQNIAGVEATLPPGLVARLAGVPLCEGAAAASGNCPAGSEIGAITIAGGAGPQPLFIPEPSKPRTHIYFGGPYKGAPYSMVIAVPAQAGPFDLGMVVVRAAVYLNPTTAQVTVKSDPVPQILQGIPIDYRDLRLEITKPSFTLNPTNCNPKQFVAAITSDEGKVVTPTSRFQVSDCSSLAFKPKLALSLEGGTKRSEYPALRAVLKQPAGQANIAKVATTLPHSEFLANEHIQTICTRVQYAANNCPEKAIYGHATAWSPLLDKPISGPVYLRSSNHELPDLVADLGGAIDIDLVGRVDSLNGGIRTTFETVPDAPVTKFVLAMQGGKKGLLVNSTNLCNGTHKAKVVVDGQNGKTADQNPLVRAQCGKARKAKKRRH